MKIVSLHNLAIPQYCKAHAIKLGNLAASVQKESPNEIYYSPSENLRRAKKLWASWNALFGMPCLRLYTCLHFCNSNFCNLHFCIISVICISVFCTSIFAFLWISVFVHFCNLHFYICISAICISQPIKYSPSFQEIYTTWINFLGSWTVNKSLIAWSLLWSISSDVAT